MTAKFWEKFKHKTFCDGRIVMINADCEAVMAEIGDKEIDLCLTDPPYGISYDSKQKAAKKTKRGNNLNYWKLYDHFSNFDHSIPSNEIFSKILMISKNQIIWGGNYFAHLLPSRQCWLIWNKGRGMFMADAELAWTSFNLVVRVFTKNRTAAHNEASQVKQKRFHPTQKPIVLMAWCLKNYSKENDLIFDAFAGSFTTAIACIRTKRRFIGVELDPIYFEKAVERVETELKQLTLF